MDKVIQNKVSEYIETVKDRIVCAEKVYPALSKAYSNYCDDLKGFDAYNNPTIDLVKDILFGGSDVPDKLAKPVSQIIAQFIHHTLRVFGFTEANVMDPIIDIYNSLSDDCENREKKAIIIGLLKMHLNIMESKGSYEDMMVNEISDHIAHSMVSKDGKDFFEKALADHAADIAKKKEEINKYGNPRVTENKPVDTLKEIRPKK